MMVCKHCLAPLQWNPVYSEWMIPDMPSISAAVWCLMEQNGLHSPAPRDEMWPTLIS